MYTYPETMGRVLNAMHNYDLWRKEARTPAATPSGVHKEVAAGLLKSSRGMQSLGEAGARPLLQAYGIPVVQAASAGSSAEAAAAAAKIGFPVVMKVVSQDILHKSDVGGIRLNLGTEAEVKHEYDLMMQQFHLKMPRAKIEGVLIEQTAPHGQEVIIGMKRDPGFGPLLMFGLGGIYVELFKDVAFRVAPVSAQEALQMVHETSAGRLLTGFRGQAKADLAAVVDCLCRISQLSLDFPEISEIEVNPLQVFAEGQGVLALDARVIFE